MKRLLWAVLALAVAVPAAAQTIITPAAYIPGSGVPRGPIYATRGSTCAAGTIGYSYNGDSNTGTTSVAADSVSQCAGATEVTRATTTSFKSFLPVYLPNGAVGAPARTWTSDPTTGEFYNSAGDFTTALSGVARVRYVADSGGSIPAVQLDASTVLSWGSSGVTSRDLYISRLGPGLLGIFNDATHGVELDVATDATAYCKSRAGADTCILKANQLTTTGAISTTGGNIVGGNTLYPTLTSRSLMRSDSDGTMRIADQTNLVGIQFSSGTAAPTVGTCGTGAIKANSRNTAGGFAATGAAACTVTFGAGSFTNTPNCTITPTKAPTTVPYISAESNTAFTVSGMTAGDNLTVDFVCVGGV